MCPPITVVFAVGTHDHRHGIPTNNALDPAFHLSVAWELRLLRWGNGVDVRRVERMEQVKSDRSCVFQDRRHEMARARPSRTLDHGLKGFLPFSCFCWISIVVHRVHRFFFLWWNSTNNHGIPLRLPISRWRHRLLRSQVSTKVAGIASASTGSCRVFLTRACGKCRPSLIGKRKPPSLPL